MTAGDYTTQNPVRAAEHAYEAVLNLLRVERELYALSADSSSSEETREWAKSGLDKLENAKESLTNLLAIYS